MEKYDHKKIEKKWQKEWEKQGIYRADDNSKKDKQYLLIEFPYPSGDGLHVGHPRPYIGLDIIAHKRRAEGFNVLYPIGWDAFGLPTENYAIKTGKHPAEVTKENTDNFRRQIKSLGISFDWSREINTTDPSYYKWTQWIFLQMFKKGLAYKAKMPINWCLSCKTGLANEEVVNDVCERCGGETEKREKEQWMLAITKYADRLHNDLDTVDYLDRIKIQQRNWIGRSEGANISFKVKSNKSKVKDALEIDVFTTRPDTIFGATYMVLAPEHELIGQLQPYIENWDEVLKYIKVTSKKNEIERTAEGKEKTGVELRGVTAINPANKEEIPVFIADYVLASYGTGAIMAVPAHDKRDHEFATKYKLPIKEVVIPRCIDTKNPHIEGKETIFREIIIGIIRDPKTGKYLCLNWKKHPWTTFVIGGIEKGETPVEAARREIKEETGYKNLKFKKNVCGPVQSEFFAAHKDVNRIAHSWSILFELENEEQEEISKEESEKHEVVWLDSSEITRDRMAHSELNIIQKQIHSDEKTVFHEEGVLINSGEFDGRGSEDAKKAITQFVDGKKQTTYKLRDWVFSRQRYWGEPIPMIHCEKCNWVPVPEEDLPVILPEVEKYEPTDSGESPLAGISEWVNVKCPKCGEDAKRETDTMPTWAGSSWYYLRYTDPDNDKELAGKKQLKKWTPVDWYNGGMEHTTLHLLYSRFWHKFLYDIDVVPTEEPYAKRTSHGLILADGGEKMSKSKGNVVNPDEVVQNVGADTLRVYEMFMGPFDQPIPWSTNNMVGSRRFLEHIWKIQTKVINSKEQIVNNKLESLLHKTIQKVTEDIEALKFNTAVSQLMILVNEFEKYEQVDIRSYKILLQLVAPFAPHITEELWEKTGEKESIHLAVWPVCDRSKITEAMFVIVIQVNGKVRGQMEVEKDISESEIQERALSLPTIKKWVDDKNIQNTIYVPQKIFNIVVKG